MNPFIALAAALSSTDDSLRFCYVMNVRSTSNLAFGLMAVNMAWQPVLENDKTQAVLAEMNGQSNSASLAAVWNSQFQMDSQNKDTQCGQWQSFVQSDQTQIDNDGDARKATFSLADGMASTCATINSLITQF